MCQCADLSRELPCDEQVALMDRQLNGRCWWCDTLRTVDHHCEPGRLRVVALGRKRPRDRDRDRDRRKRPARGL